MNTSAQLRTLRAYHIEIVDKLAKAGEKGINSRYSSLRRKYAQLPARIFELKNLGFKIASLPAKRRSVAYVLTRSPKWYVVPKPKPSLFDILFKRKRDKEA